MFTVSVAAPDRNLLTLAEIKSALGVTATDRDAELEAFGLQISDLIAQECGVPGDGVAPPTLRRETLIETIRLDRPINALILARRFVADIVSLAADGAILAAADYETDRAAGMVARLFTSRVVAWSCATLAVTYSAGFETVPSNLKLAAVTVAREQWSAGERDPLVRKETVDGVGSTEYWVNASTGSGSDASALSGAARAMLAPYRYYVV